MPSPERAFAWLLRKEWRELLSARAFWVMLLLTGPLVGAAFISAVNAYAELSGLHGTSVGTGEAFSPLIGIWSPTFSGYELVAAFLLPFVTIRVFSGDRQSGAGKLEQQHALSSFARVAAKALVRLAAPRPLSRQQSRAAAAGERPRRPVGQDGQHQRVKDYVVSPK